MRQLVGFGFALSVRDFLRLTALAGVVGVVLGVAAGDLLIGPGVDLLLRSTPVGDGTRLAVREAAAVALAIAVVYVATLDLARGSLTTLRVRVSASPLRGLWAALDIGRAEAVMAERGVAIAVRAAVLGALLAGAGLRLARVGSPAASSLAELAVAVVIAHLGLNIGLALLHARRRAALSARRSWWLLAAVPPLLLGVGAARISASIADAGRSGSESGGNAWGAEVAGWALRLDAEQVLVWMSLAAVVPTVIGIALAVVGVVAADAPEPPGAAEREAPIGLGRRAGLVRAVEVGTGAARRSSVVARVLALVVAAAALLVGWRLGGGGLLAGGDGIGRALSVSGVFAAAVVSSTAVAIAGQNATFAHLRHLWELGAPGRQLYLACAWVGLRRAVVLQAALVVIGVVGWGLLPWRAVVAVGAVVLGDLLVDSYFARPRATEPDAAGDPAAAVASVALLVAIVACALWTTSAGAVALIIVTILIGGTGPWLFVSRLRQLPA